MILFMAPAPHFSVQNMPPIVGNDFLSPGRWGISRASTDVILDNSMKYLEKIWMYSSRSCRGMSGRSIRDAAMNVEPFAGSSELTH
jgi:hypothetical protein